MVETNISPGVYTTLTDLSEYVRKVPTAIGFIPIFCERGRDNQLILTNARDFFIEFGEPNIHYAIGGDGHNYSYGHYVASSFLSESDSLYVIRCTDDAAQFANIEFKPSAETYATATNMNTIEEIQTQVDNNDSIMFYGLGRGEYYNNFKIKVEKYSNLENVDNDLFLISIQKKLKESFEEPVATYDTTEESVTIIKTEIQYATVEKFEVSLLKNKVDHAGVSRWIEDVINSNSKYIRCIVSQDFDFDPDDPVDLSTTSSGVSLQSGSDGNLVSNYESLLAKAYVGRLKKNISSSEEYYVDEVLNTEDYYFSMVFDAGYPINVKNSIAYLVSSRKDCLGIIDLGDNATPEKSLLVRTNNLNFDNKYIAIYEPFTKIYDVFTGKDIWVPSTYHLAKLFPALKKEWLAPAGFDFGVISGIKEMRFSPSSSQRDSFYLKQINPIVRFNEGYAVYSQLTSQARPTALQDVNIMRVYLYIKRALEQFCKWYIFNLNNEETWARINQKVTAFLSEIKTNGGLYSFSVSVGATDEQKKAKEIHVNIMLEPVRLAERIYVNFTIK